MSKKATNTIKADSKIIVKMFDSNHTNVIISVDS